MFLKLKNVDVFFLYINIYFRTLIDRHTKALRFISEGLFFPKRQPRSSLAPDTVSVRNSFAGVFSGKKFKNFLKGATRCHVLCVIV